MRVSHVMADPDTWWRPLDSYQFAEAIEQFGVEWLPGAISAEGIKCRSSDVCLIDNRLLDSWDWSQPTIIWEKIDQCNIGHRTRGYLDHPNCRGVIKPGVYEKLEDHNEFVVSNSRLAYLIGDPRPVEKLPSIKQEHLDRVMVINTNIWASVLGSDWYFDRLPSDKPIDVGLSMQVGGSPAFYGIHRKLLAWQVMKELLGKNVSMNICVDGHPVPARASFEILRQSKVAICPFGVTEHCFRDWEATLAGCVIVKPRVRPMSVMDYPWSKVVWCEPDFEDLREKVEEALDVVDLWRSRILDQRERLINRLRGFKYLAAFVRQAIGNLLEG